MIRQNRTNRAVPVSCRFIYVHFVLFRLIKSVLSISCVFWIFFQNTGSQLCFRCYCQVIIYFLWLTNLANGILVWAKCHLFLFLYEKVKGLHAELDELFQAQQFSCIYKQTHAYAVAGSHSGYCMPASGDFCCHTTQTSFAESIPDIRRWIQQTSLFVWASVMWTAMGVIYTIAWANSRAGRRLLRLCLQSWPDLNQKFNIVINPSESSVCYTARPQLCVLGGRRCTVKCKPRSVLLWISAKHGWHPS